MSVQEKSYYALAAFCENMGEEILPFLDPLMVKLLGALQSSTRKLQETCMVTRVRFSGFFTIQNEPLIFFFGSKL